MRLTDIHTPQPQGIYIYIYLADPRARLHRHRPVLHIDLQHPVELAQADHALRRQAEAVGRERRAHGADPDYGMCVVRLLVFLGWEQVSK